MRLDGHIGLHMKGNGCLCVSLQACPFSRASTSGVCWISTSIAMSFFSIIFICENNSSNIRPFRVWTIFSSAHLGLAIGHGVGTLPCRCTANLSLWLPLSRGCQTIVLNEKLCSLSFVSFSSRELYSSPWVTCEQVWKMMDLLLCLAWKRVVSCDDQTIFDSSKNNISSAEV